MSMVFGGHDRERETESERERESEAREIKAQKDKRFVLSAIIYDPKLQTVQNSCDVICCSEILIQPSIGNTIFNFSILYRTLVPTE